MVISSVNNSQNVKTKNKGGFGAYMSYGAVATAASLPAIPVLAIMQKVSKISQQDSIDLGRAAKKSLKETGLLDKGYKIVKLKQNKTYLKSITDENELIKFFKNVFVKTDKKERQLANSITNLLEETSLFKKFSKNPNLGAGMKIGNMIKSKMMTGQVKMGANAFCLPQIKRIVTPDKLLQTSVFHEMGHALNYENKLLKVVQKFRPIGQKVLPLAILLTAITNKRKVEEPQSQNDSKMQKFKDFVKRNAGKLTLLSFLPMVAEEGIASLRGSKLAKQHVINGNLSQNVFKKIKITNAYGFASYVLAAVGSALAMKVAVNVKDKVQAKHEQKIAQKMQNN